MGTSTDTGVLNWNANGSLGSLAITDQINPADSQTCNYSHDDLGRIASVNCGSAWAQTFTYDPYGNITKSGSSNWQPGYNNSNQYTLGGTSYDANGNLLTDTFHTYSYDADGNVISLDGNAIVYDALGRMVQEGSTSLLMGPLSGKPLASMSGQTANEQFVPLPGGAMMRSNWGYRHGDWLGSVRLQTSFSQTLVFDSAYAPFGENYAGTGPHSDNGFTQGSTDSLGKLLTTDLYDFDFRKYEQAQGRWMTPDPAGMAAADPANPQSWNRYAYVMNNPLNAVDRRGLFPNINQPPDDDDGGGGGDLFGGLDPCIDFGFCGFIGGLPTLPPDPATGVLRKAMQNAAVALGNKFCAGVVDEGTGIAASTLTSNFVAMSGTSDPAEIASFGNITTGNVLGDDLGIGGLTHSTPGVITGSNPGVSGALSTITMNSNLLGFFMNPWLVSVMSTNHTGTGYSNETFQTIELLHELGHGSSAYGAPSSIMPDGDDRAVSVQNTETIENGCFPQGDFGGNQGPTSVPTDVPAVSRPHPMH